MIRNIFDILLYVSMGSLIGAGAQHFLQSTYKASEDSNQFRSHLKMLWLLTEWHMKALKRQRGSAGFSESSMGAHVIFKEMLWPGSYINFNVYLYDETNRVKYRHNSLMTEYFSVCFQSFQSM